MYLGKISSKSHLPSVPNWPQETGMTHKQLQASAGQRYNPGKCACVCMCVQTSLNDTTIICKYNQPYSTNYMMDMHYKKYYR